MKASFDLSGKVALVTGASRGIGKALAEGLAYAGSDVILVARTEEQVNSAATEIAQKTGRKTLALVCDVTNNSSVEEAVNEALKYFGHIDILVNNAGASIRKTTFDLSEEDWDQVMSVNFKSVF